MNHRTSRSAIFALPFVAGIIIGNIFVAVIGRAWDPPTEPAPNGNVSPPINVGAISQIKDGAIGVNGLAVLGNSILQQNGSVAKFAWRLLGDMMA
ncbi:hypothetical protein D1O30_19360 [Methylocystis hirsuta]|uniref:Uncharacterized protein n=2 Tax=Methylocystis hirsuta TaxID=369798 RepID=A0A3M9XMB5_9HYPH|nr:hypothetical protein D1O30_19360 [Methylocystis hirsuta]